MRLARRRCRRWRRLLPDRTVDDGRLLGEAQRGDPGHQLFRLDLRRSGRRPQPRRPADDLAQLTHLERLKLDEEKLEAVAVASSGVAVVEAREDVRRLLALLPARAGRIVELRYGHELTVKEMASVLHVAESGVRKIAGRQLRRAAKDAGLIE
ncbi:MAG TPA: sigma factor-like helix-turn-helix DNA-binding protein [Thermoanaerobaculia bacterium]|nr:sigma factor-like helix-turn-helix DNA-binding protein [Thermoanaerobaculia bacterium]